MKVMHAAAFAALCLCIAAPASAHRVNLFGWQEGDVLKTESKFAGGRPAKNSEVVAFDVSGKKIGEGRTDDKGEWSFKCDPKVCNGQLTIVLNAGEGHRAEWKLDWEGTSESNSAEADTAAAPQTAKSTQEYSAPAVSVEEAVQKAVNAERARIEKEEIAPLRKKIAELQEPQIGWREIFGGIGWIVGLFGIAAWWSGRRRQS